MRIQHKQSDIWPLMQLIVVGLSTLILSLFVFAPTTSAQVGENFTGASISLRPPYPGPNKLVQATYESYSINPGLDLITWRLNGEVVQQDYGEEKYEFVTGEVGSYIHLSVSVLKPNGITTTEETSFIVSDVAIVWEGKTYTPPFYKGKASQSSGSEVVFQALPHVTDANGATIDPSSLLFEWSPTALWRSKESGRGMDTVVFRNSEPFEPFDMGVTVKDGTGKIRAQARVVIPLTAPKLLLYQEHPLLGILYRRALAEDFELLSNEGILVAEPYFMSAESRTDPVLDYEWQVGEQLLPTPGRIVLRPEGTGSARVQLVVTSSLVWQQKAREDINISFSRDGTSFGGQNTDAL